ncbi:MAG TPA: hypothetical protein VMR75_03655, partial [Candidatus Saccharimonadales bacterium]|nr:hypothetical protein [Candidatus Saccharimonadales bacterium]
SGFAISIAQVFWVGSGLMALALIVTLFLEEIPLRRTHEPEVPTESGELGRDLAVEEGTLPAADEPLIAATQASGKNVLDLRER